MKKIIIVISLVSSLLTGCGAADTASADETTVIDLPKTVEAYGIVQVKEKENIAIEVAGRITEINVLNGQAVAKGDVLFKMDISDYLNQLDQKKMALVMKEQELSLMTSGKDEELSSQEKVLAKQLEAKSLELSNLTSQYNTLKNNLANGSDENLGIANMSQKNAEKLYNDAMIGLSQNQSLYDQGIIAKTEMNRIIQETNAMKFNYDNSVMTYNSLKKQKEEETSSLLVQISYVSSELSQLESQNEQSSIESNLKALEIEQLISEIENLEDNLDSRFISESGEVICHMKQGIFDGFLYTSGDMITGDSTRTIYTMNNSEALEIYAKVSEDFIQDLYVGQKATVTPVASREQSFPGVITAIASIAYQEGGEAVIPVWVSVDDPEGFMKGNYSVDVAFELDEMIED